MYMLMWRKGVRRETVAVVDIAENFFVRPVNDSFA